ncbi:MAG: hypothetical protein HC811_07175 [Flammeovirgaceae bacterium]|nr:hypothetical protein [Flammeovirgaceae bacterium]
MADLSGRLLNPDQVNDLHKERKHEWFLLDIVERNENGKVNKVMIVKHSPSKDDLRDYILELSDSGEKQYIFFFSDPDNKCEL